MIQESSWTPVLGFRHEDNEVSRQIATRRRSAVRGNWASDFRPRILPGPSARLATFGCRLRGSRIWNRGNFAWPGYCFTLKIPSPNRADHGTILHRRISGKHLPILNSHGCLRPQLRRSKIDQTVLPTSPRGMGNLVN